MIEVSIVPDARAGGAALADELYALLAARPAAVLGVATGSSPELVYAALADRLRARPLDLSGVRVFALDEYLGIDFAHPQSYHTYVREHVTEPLGLDPARVHVPEGDGEPGQEFTAYDAAIAAAGGVDLQILGIGHNAHIGFNEPGTPFTQRTHIERLDDTTRRANSRFFASPDAVPAASITQGPATILAARRIVLLAFGAGKAEAVAAAVTGEVTERVPASVLQRHPDVTFIVDREAASLLPPGH